MGSQVTREVDSVLYARRHRDGCRGVEDVHRAGGAALPRRVEAAQIRETLPPGEIEFILDHVYKLPRRIEQFLEGDHPISEIAQRYHDAHFFLYLGRHMPAGGARGALKLKEILHPDRGVLGRGDEARPDRASRRADAGRRRGDEHPRLRQDRVEHPEVRPAAPTSSRSRRTATRTSSTTRTT